jgi:hypothetical protein
MGATSQFLGENKRFLPNELSSRPERSVVEGPAVSFSRLNGRVLGAQLGQLAK